MCTADEVALVYAMNGADGYALATARALRVIDNREVVDHVYSIVGTVLLALTAADTAVGARLTSVGALSVARALNHDARGVADKVDDGIGTGPRADAAADALSRVDPCDAVLNGDSALGTYVDAVAVAKAGIGTELVARVRHIGGAAALYALVVVLALGSGAGAVAGYVSDLLDNIARLKTEDGCDSLCGVVAAGDTEVTLLALALRESLCIAVTAAVAAGAAVGTRETVADFNLVLVDLNAEEAVCKSKKNGADYCDRAEDRY